MSDRVSKANYYLDIAQTVAERATCMRRHFGAIIVKDDVIVSTGYNGAPRGRKNCTDINFCISESDSMFDANSVKYLHTDVDTHVIRPVYNKDGGNHAYMLYYNDSNSSDVVFPYINSVSTKSYYVDEAILNHDSKTVNLKVNIELKDSGALEEVSLSSLINTTFGHEGTEIVGFNENRDMTKPQEFMVVGTDGTYTLFIVKGSIPV